MREPDWQAHAAAATRRARESWEDTVAFAQHLAGRAAPFASHAAVSAAAYTATLASAQVRVRAQRNASHHPRASLTRLLRSLCRRARRSYAAFLASLPSQRPCWASSASASPPRPRARRPPRWRDGAATAARSTLSAGSPSFRWTTSRWTRSSAQRSSWRVPSLCRCALSMPALYSRSRHGLFLRLWAGASAPCCRATFASWCVAAAQSGCYSKQACSLTRAFCRGLWRASRCLRRGARTRRTCSAPSCECCSAATAATTAASASAKSSPTTSLPTKQSTARGTLRLEVSARLTRALRRAGSTAAAVAAAAADRVVKDNPVVVRCGAAALHAQV